MTKKSVALIVAMAIVITAGITISAQSIFAAWTEPTATAPGDNISAPINVGTDTQSKAGKYRAVGGIVIQNSAGTPAGVENGSMWLQ